MVGIIECWELGRTGNWDEDFGGIPSSPSLDGIEQQWFAFAVPLTSPDRAGPSVGVCWLLGCTVNNNPSPRLLPPLQRSFAARIATEAWIGTGSDSKQGDAMRRKVPPVFGTAEQELPLLHNVVDEREPGPG